VDSERVPVLQLLQRVRSETLITGFGRVLTDHICESERNLMPQGDRTMLENINIFK
jgi:hypothetical protein